jgi:hypothetical protein
MMDAGRQALLALKDRQPPQSLADLSARTIPSGD